jgi:hypothetical protein
MNHIKKCMKNNLITAVLYGLDYLASILPRVRDLFFVGAPKPALGPPSLLYSGYQDKEAGA